MKETLLEINAEDLPKIEELIENLAKEKDCYLKFKIDKGEVWDEVFYPKPKKKLVYVVPEGRILFCLLCMFEWHGELVERAKEVGVGVEKVVVNFL
jgi:hypothetical protein